MDTPGTHDELHQQAPTLAAVPKADPFRTPDAYFDRFPQQVQAAIAAQRPRTAPRWYARWALALPLIALATLGTWWALHTPTSGPVAQTEAEVTPLSEAELAYLDASDMQMLAEEGEITGIGEVDVDLTDEELLAYLDNEHADLTELITEE